MSGKGEIMSAKVLMVQGTTSSAGKSLLVTALCHLYARRGVRVAPFKSQNMSNNAAVCPDGSEIGRAQAIQAVAAGLEPCVEMNPILIKPEQDFRSQVVVMGRPWQTLTARDYYRNKQALWQTAAAALDSLREQYELVIIEGAGSPVEMNLKAGDIVNMAVARYANAPVLLVSDIDRGGVFAQLLGTLWLLLPEERSLVRGLVVNKFRGDMSLFTDGVAILEEKGSVPVLGVLPYLQGLSIPEEDAVSLEDLTQTQKRSGDEGVDIAVIQLPRIANFDDFDPLAQESGARVRYVDETAVFGSPDAVIIPGTKSTMADLAWLRATGLATVITSYAQNGGEIVGICGGYQMLGRTIRDNEGVESGTGVVPGLGLLKIETRFFAEKVTHRVVATVSGGAGWLAAAQGESIQGYEIHMGRTDTPSPWLHIEQRGEKSVTVMDGAMSENGRVWGCYLHGLFANVNLRHRWLVSLGWQPANANATDPDAAFAASLSRLADVLEESLNMELLEEIIWGN